MNLDMTKGSPAKLILRFIIPVILGNLFQQLYNMVDTIVVGRFVGKGALAAVGSTGTISFMILGFMMGLTAGFTVLTGQRYGAGDYAAVRKSAGNAFVLSGIITAVMTVVSVAAMDPILRLLQTPSDIFAMARSYIVIICAGMVCTVLYTAGGGKQQGAAVFPDSVGGPECRSGPAFCHCIPRGCRRRGLCHNHFPGYFGCALCRVHGDEN